VKVESGIEEIAEIAEEVNTGTKKGLESVI